MISRRLLDLVGREPRQLQPRRQLLVAALERVGLLLLERVELVPLAPLGVDALEPLAEVAARRIERERALERLDRLGLVAESLLPDLRDLLVELPALERILHQRQLAREHAGDVGPTPRLGEGRRQLLERRQVVGLQVDDALQRRGRQQLLPHAVAIERRQLEQQRHALGVVAAGVLLFVLERVGERAPALGAVEEARQLPARRALGRIGGDGLAPGVDDALGDAALGRLARRLDERALLVADDLGVALVGDIVVEVDDEHAVDGDAAHAVEVVRGARHVALRLPGDGTAEERGVDVAVLVERRGQERVDRRQQLVPGAPRGVDAAQHR